LSEIGPGRLRLEKERSGDYRSEKKKKEERRKKKEEEEEEE
jgi:hypothetical protein